MMVRPSTTSGQAANPAGAPELRFYGPYASATAAINGETARHPSRVISARAGHHISDRGDHDRRDEDLRPAVDVIRFRPRLTVGLLP